MEGKNQWNLFIVSGIFTTADPVFRRVRKAYAVVAQNQNEARKMASAAVASDDALAARDADPVDFHVEARGRLVDLDSRLAPGGSD